jgi:hypothetical protein
MREQEAAAQTHSHGQSAGHRADVGAANRQRHGLRGAVPRRLQRQLLVSPAQLPVAQGNGQRNRRRGGDESKQGPRARHQEQSFAVALR